MTDKMEEALRRIAAKEKAPADIITSCWGDRLNNCIQIARDALPRPLEVGDRVRPTDYTHGNNIGVVRGVYMNTVWVEWNDSGMPVTRGADLVERI